MTGKEKEEKNDDEMEEEEKEHERRRRSKHTLIDFSFALALPDRHAETAQLYTRVGDSKEEGQMLMKMTARSGEYALQIRYFGVGIGVDTDKWQVIVTDEKQRTNRHIAILTALRDSLLSPDGAMVATMLPHLTGLQGAIVVRSTAGRAPMYSALCDDFVTRLQALADENCHVYPFAAIDEFNAHMNRLIQHSFPCFPASYRKNRSETSMSGME